MDGLTASNLIKNATKLLGTPYVWAGSTLSGFDCSGFIYYVYNQVGVSLPRTSSAGYYNRSFYVNNPQPGDLVFFSDTYQKGISHLGIYLGNNQFIHASDNGVEISSLDEAYWKNHFDGFKRLYEVV
nr:C40 family peptidase [Bacillus sp. FJAT-49736]